MQNYANFMHPVNLHSGRPLFLSLHMTAIRWQLIETVCVLWFACVWELTRCLYIRVTVYFHRAWGRLTAITDPDANQRAIHFKQTPHQLPDLHAGVVHRIPWLPHDFPSETGLARGLLLYVSNNRKTEGMVASVSSVNALFVGGVFFHLPSLEGRGAVDEFLSRSRW